MRSEGKVTLCTKLISLRYGHLGRKKVDSLLPVLDLYIKDFTLTMSSSIIRLVSTRKTDNIYIVIKLNIILFYRTCSLRVKYCIYTRVTIIDNFIPVIKCIKTVDKLSL